jgi:hypothetical protein
VNEAPVGVTDTTYSAVEGAGVIGAPVLINDTDPEGDALTVSMFATNLAGTGSSTANGVNSIATALGGSVVMNSDGSFIYTAPAFRNHSDVTPDIDSFAYMANDGSLDSAWTEVRINVTDTVPVANDDVDSLIGGSPVGGNVITGVIPAGTGGADIIGADATGITNVVLTQGTPTSNNLVGNVRTIITSNGTLVIDQSDGSYTYTAVTKTVNAGTNAADQGVWTAAGIVTYGYDNVGSGFADPYLGSTPASGIDIAALTSQQAGNVDYSNSGGTNNDGLGVSNGVGGTSEIETNEHLLINLGFTTTSATVTLTSMNGNESATWSTFAADGSFVQTGTIAAGGGNEIVSIGTLPFTFIVLTAATGDDFRIDGITATSVMTEADIFTYTLTDGDGSVSSATLTINPATTTQVVTVNITETANDVLGTAGGDLLNGTPDSDNIQGYAGVDTLDGDEGDDILYGGAGADILTGGAGADTFAWRLVDAGAPGTPESDTITDFSISSRVAGGDVLDLRDLLTGELGATAADLDNYLHFEFSGADTILHISSAGGFGDDNFIGGAAPVPASETQQIVFTGVDLTVGLITDQQLIQSLLTDQKLLTD